MYRIYHMAMYLLFPGKRDIDLGPRREGDPEGGPGPGPAWVYLGLLGSPGVSLGLPGSPWVPLGLPGAPWGSPGFPRAPWGFPRLHGAPRGFSKGSQEFSRDSLGTLYGFVRVSLGILWA